MKFLLRHKITLTLTVLFIVFNDFFISLYQKYVVDKILIKVSKTIVLDILFVSIIIFLIYWFVTKMIIRFYLKNDYIFYSVISVTGFILVRIKYENQLLYFYNIQQIKYFDLFGLLILMPPLLIIWFWIKSKNDQKSQSFFFNDAPIDNFEEDILNRKSKVQQVMRLINSNKTTSLAIGIVGEWGDGKTTFMKFVENSFKNDDKFVIVQFNSWLNISVNSIIHDFFNTIEDKMSNYSIDISKEIKRYGNNVLSLHKNSTTETLLNVLNVIPDTSVSENFENLNSLLNKLNKKVIVFFDDLDRLQPNEVFEVLKLIRNTASFDIFSYVVGYDKAYLISALEKNDIPFPEKYCEKIFLKEFPLTPITQEQINTFIKSKILDQLPEKKEEIDGTFEYINTFMFYNETNMFSSIKNIRNAKRFLNEFRVSIQEVKDDINISDFILIKLLKHSFYDVYRLLFNKNVYLENKEEGFSGAKKYVNYKLRKNDKKEVNFSTFGREFNISLLREDLVNLNLFSEVDLKIIGSICDKLFNKSNYNNSDSALSISYGNNYFKYFEDEISDTELTYLEFKIFLESKLNRKIQIIDKAYKEDKIVGLILFIYKINIYTDIKSRAEYEDLIKSLFYIANLKSTNTHINYFGFDFETLDGFISNYKNQTVEFFNYEDTDDLKKFYKSVFYEKREYYDFESDYVKHLFDRSGTSTNVDIPFNRKEMEDYLCYCFDNDSKLINAVDDKFWHCYRLCILKDWKKASSNSWSQAEKIIEINKEKFLYEIIPNYIDAFLVTTVYPQSFYGEDNNSYKVGVYNDPPVQLIGSFDQFIEYLESEKLKEKLPKPSIFMEEFLIFAKEVNKTKSYIDFEFTYPPIIEKLKNASIRNIKK